MTDGSGVEITSREELEEIIRRGAERGWPVGVHAIGDQANRNALDAFEATRDAWEPKGLRQRIEHAQCLAPEDCPASPSSASPARSSSRTLRPTVTSPTGSGPTGSRAPTPSARCSSRARVVANGSDAPVEELDPIAGHRRRRAPLDRRAAGLAAGGDADGRAGAARHVRRSAWLSGDERRRGRLLPGCSPTSSCSTATRSPSSRRSCASSQVVATMVGGRWVHNPPPWD